MLGFQNTVKNRLRKQISSTFVHFFSIFLVFALFSFVYWYIDIYSYTLYILYTFHEIVNIKTLCKLIPYLTIPGMVKLMTNMT